MLTNQDPNLLRSEFKRRYLAEFSTYVGGLMEESSGHSANFLFMFLVLAVGPLSLPVAGLLGLGVSARYAQVQKSVKAALAEASAQARQEMTEKATGALTHVETWLDAHEDNLPVYLDRLDRYEEDRRRVRALIDRCNKAGSVASLSSEDRALLKRHGVTRVRTPLYAGFTLPARCQLGNWHFSQLDRALWRDISRIAGKRGKMIGRILGVAHAG
jgi:hypothetical protein